MTAVLTGTERCGDPGTHTRGEDDYMKMDAETGDGLL